LWIHIKKQQISRSYSRFFSSGSQNKFFQRNFSAFFPKIKNINQKLTLDSYAKASKTIAEGAFCGAGMGQHGSSTKGHSTAF